MQVKEIVSTHTAHRPFEVPERVKLYFKVIGLSEGLGANTLSGEYGAQADELE